MINHQGIPCTVYAYSKKNPLKVKIKYLNHVHYDACDGKEHCGLTTVDVSDLFIQSFDSQTELGTAIRKAPYYFDRDGIHVNDLPSEPVEEVASTIIEVGAKSSKKLGASKYNVDIEEAKKMLAKGTKKSEICKTYKCPSWYLGKMLKRSN